jgi:hypothetical protein
MAMTPIFILNSPASSHSRHAQLTCFVTIPSRSNIKLDNINGWSLSDDKPISSLKTETTTTIRKKEVQKDVHQYQLQIDIFWCRVDTLKNEVAEQERAKQQLDYLKYQQGPKMVPPPPLRSVMGSNPKRTASNHMWI